jgi:MFS family permease
MLFATALFTFGSGICGGASSGGMLIAGRAIQGAGSGGAVLLCSRFFLVTPSLFSRYHRAWFS